jgi:hypothetical protein
MVHILFEDYDLPSLQTVDGIADVDDASAAGFKDTEDNTIGGHAPQLLASHSGGGTPSAQRPIPQGRANTVNVE